MQQSAPQTFEIDGRELSVPMRVGHATGSLSAFLADADAVARRLPAGLSPVRLPLNHGVVLVMAVRYVDSPLGEYDELVIGLAARPTQRDDRTLESMQDVLRGRFGVWIEHMPVTQAFPREAGEVIWGYPKTVDELASSTDGRRSSMAWRRDGEPIAEVAVRTGGRLPLPSLPTSTYTRKDGVVHRTALRARARGAGVGVLGAELALGTHDVAAGLRELGLARRPVAAAWFDHVQLDFEPAVPLHAAQVAV